MLLAHRVKNFSWDTYEDKAQNEYFLSVTGQDPYSKLFYHYLVNLSISKNDKNQ